MKNKFTFGSSYIFQACKVWVEDQHGKRQEFSARGKYSTMMRKAAEWIEAKKQALQQEADYGGEEVEFEFTDGLNSPWVSKTISQPSDWWEAFEAAARAEGVSLAEWVGTAAKSALPTEVRTSLSYRIPLKGSVGAKERTVTV